MPVQTTASHYHQPAYEGMVASVSELLNTRSYFAEGSNILPGRAVMAGTDGEKQATLPSAAADAAIVGVTMYEINRVHSNDIPENEDRPMSVVTDGVLWVRVINGCSVNDPAHVVIDTAGGDDIGQFHSAADSTNTVLMTGAKFISAAAAGGLAKLSIKRT